MANQGQHTTKGDNMTKKHFIALADVIKRYNFTNTDSMVANGPKPFNSDQIECLARFCKQENPRFMPDRWLSYINGECGPNGGKV